MSTRKLNHNHSQANPNAAGRPYSSEDQVREQAQQEELLIPINLDLDVNSFKIRDAFVWNLRGTLVLAPCGTYVKRSLIYSTSHREINLARIVRANFVR